MMSSIPSNVPHSARAAYHEHLQVCDALCRWFSSQEVSQMQAGAVMLRLTGIIIGQHSSSSGQMRERLDVAGKALEATALEQIELT